MQNDVLTHSSAAFSLLVLFIYLVINFYGVKLLARVGNAITTFKMAVLVIIVLIFIVYALMHSPSHVSMLSADIPNNS